MLVGPVCSLPVCCCFAFDNLFRSGQIYGFLWLEDAIAIDELCWDDPDDLNTIRDYFSWLLIPNISVLARLMTVSHRTFLTVSNRRDWDFKDDHCDLCKPLPKHGALACRERHYCPLSVTNGCYRFRFSIPPLKIPSPSLKPTETGLGSDSVWFEMTLWRNQRSRLVL